MIPDSSVASHNTHSSKGQVTEDVLANLNICSVGSKHIQIPEFIKKPENNFNTRKMSLRASWHNLTLASQGTHNPSSVQARDRQTQTELSIRKNVMWNTEEQGLLKKMHEYTATCMHWAENAKLLALNQMRRPHLLSHTEQHEKEKSIHLIWSLI